MAVTIARAGAGDLDELLALMGSYCEFYGVAPGSDALRALTEALLADPDGAGIQLIARDEGGTALGFATLYWTYSTLAAARIGVMNDLYVEPAARRAGVATALIRACEAECAARGVGVLEWETAPENDRAQSVYDRVGAARSTWVTYSLAVTPR